MRIPDEFSGRDLITVSATTFPTVNSKSSNNQNPGQLQQGRQGPPGAAVQQQRNTEDPEEEGPSNKK
ncbi:hypothetical protein Nepgr_026670 [Nepenthes gracilis]|uniref:Uncharacterized protein n=1 Tax=Nepenthes gracilis TaxID=150966 RepID=A0AAD3TA64_NEPGR|nr:hypothetical protein Nepgr_026670 [Nepenthes gracilis]